LASISPIEQAKISLPHPFHQIFDNIMTQSMLNEIVDVNGIKQKGMTIYLNDLPGSEIEGQVTNTKARYDRSSDSWIVEYEYRLYDSLTKSFGEWRHRVFVLNWRISGATRQQFNFVTFQLFKSWQARAANGAS
jgi:hypothetical protein